MSGEPVPEVGQARDEEVGRPGGKQDARINAPESAAPADGVTPWQRSPQGFPAPSQRSAGWKISCPDAVAHVHAGSIRRGVAVG